MKKKQIAVLTTGIALLSIPIQAHAFELIKQSTYSNGINVTAKPNIANNSIRLDWSGDTKNRTFKVYQKKPGSTEFQSISATNFDGNKQVKVLNIYPAGGAVESYTTWDGEQISLMKSASLKRWMEEPNSENPKGYGKGIIEVTPVLLSEFNRNPEAYLKNADGSWKHDVVMVGSWDCNGSCTIDGDLSQSGASVIREFIQDGRGALLGHDSAYYSNVHSNLNSLMDLFNIKIGHGIHTTTVPTSFSGSTIKINKKGLLTNYPWLIGDVGTNLTVPHTHTTGQMTKGDIWMKFNGAEPEYDGGYKSNFYLTTWNNTGYVLTGHSNGSATPDEQKLLANTLFYLNQLSTDTFLEDNSGQDVNAPNKVNNITHSFSDGFINFKLTRPTDNGSSYQYYVVGEGKDGSTIQSNTVSATITSGIKGYSFVVDNNPNTVPDNTVDTTSDTIKANITSNNLYLHVKAIDNAGNVSDVTHYNISDTTAPTMNITGNPTSWVNRDITLSVSASDVGTGVREIVLPNGTIVKGNNATYNVSANGNYTFIVRDNMGNQKTQVVNVSKIDKTINNIMNVNQSMSMVNANNSTRRMTFTFNPVTDSISGIKGYSYVIDKNPSTIPDNTVNTTGTTITKDITDTGMYYLHIKAIDNAGNISNVIHHKVDVPNLKSQSKPTENKIRLDWTMNDLNGKTFKVYQKKEGSNEYQSISATNLNSSKQVRVLNLYPYNVDPNYAYPTTGEITFTTWDGETMTLPQSAQLKKWMEEPNAENPKGYGKGIIEVTPVKIDEFNANPKSYLSKDANGKYNYDVIAIGNWDGNASNDLTSSSASYVNEFVQNGGGILFGHDTIGLRANITNYFTNELKAIKSTTTYGNASAGKSSITVKKKGLLTNYPWEIGDIGTQLVIPQAHTWQMANADVWLDFNTSYPQTGSLIVDNTGTNNHYLTTNNNLALIQTGHSKGQATPDEQKILANTLFYLNQLSNDNYLDDYSGQDVKAPNIPVIYEHKFTSNNNVEFKFHEVQDNGSDYSYYVESLSKDNSLTLSNVVNETITSGLKGYSYVVDNNPNTIPDDTIEQTTNKTIRVNVNENTKYVHIKAIDKVGNSSETYHYKITDATNPTMTITGNPTEWTNKDITLNITADDKDSGLNYIELPNGNRVRTNNATYTITQNGNYTFKAVDYMGNVTTQTISVTKIDKTLPVINTTTNIDSNKLSGSIVINVSDTISGLDYLVLPNGNKITAPNYTLNITQNGVYLFTAYDKAGNMTIKTVNIDGLNANVVPSEIARIEYKLSGATTKDWTTYTGAFYITNEGITTITSRSYDKAGNVSDEKTSTVKIDKTKPANNSILIELK